MSLIERVTAVIAELGEGDADDVLAELGDAGHSRRQVIVALQNARQTGRLESDGARPPVKGSRTARLTTYRPAQPKERPLPAASVWAYAAVYARHCQQGGMKGPT